MKNILHIDASGRHAEKSDSKQLTAKIVKQISTQSTQVHYRDLSRGLPLLNDEMIESYFTAPNERNESQKEVIGISDQLVQELIDRVGLN